jgi:hypothetical protein
MRVAPGILRRSAPQNDMPAWSYLKSIGPEGTRHVLIKKIDEFNRFLEG